MKDFYSPHPLVPPLLLRRGGGNNKEGLAPLLNALYEGGIALGKLSPRRYLYEED